MNNELYQEIIKFIVESGKRIKSRAGKIEDIGITKQFLTEEDIAIERGIKNIIKKANPDHELFAEEENNQYPAATDVWVCDPISGTLLFLNNEPHYAIVLAHTTKKIPVFAVVYDPSNDTLYTAYKNGGVYKNGIKLPSLKKTTNERPIIVLKRTRLLKNAGIENLITDRLPNCDILQQRCSNAIACARVVEGQFDGIITCAKDIFPEVASSLLISEAGGKFTSQSGKETIEPAGRLFFGGNIKIYNMLKEKLTDLKLPTI